MISIPIFPIFDNWGMGWVKENLCYDYVCLYDDGTLFKRQPCI